MSIFETNAERYDRWYERNKELYEKELSVIPEPVSPSLEIGVGTGRFASALGIDVGVDISLAMLRIAKSRKVECLQADAGSLPFRDGVFKSAYLIFTLCFLDEPAKAIAEAKRVLEGEGFLVTCIIPKNSGLGEEYASKNSPFYRVAKFYTENEVITMLKKVGFEITDVRKTRLKYSENDFVCFTAKHRNNKI
ncbi:class I SAM-dependent methyltransferase [Archaeoglobus sp.]